MLLCRNSSTVSLFLCHVRTAHPSQTQSRSQFSTCRCAVWNWSVFYKFILQCLMTTEVELPEVPLARESNHHDSQREHLRPSFQRALSFLLSARSFCESILFLHLKVQKEAQLTTSERLQVQKENALTERARWKQALRHASTLYLCRRW